MRRIALPVIAALACLLVAAVATPAAFAADPPPERVEGQHIYDPDGLLGDALVPTAGQLTDLVADLHDVDVFVVARQRGGTVDEPDVEATQAAHAVVDAWGLESAVVLYVEAPVSGCNSGIGIATAGPVPAANLDPGSLLSPEVRQAQELCLPGVAAIDALGSIVTELAGIGTEEEPATNARAAVPRPGDRSLGLRPGRRLLDGDDRPVRGDDRRDRSPDRRGGRRLQPGRRLRDDDSRRPTATPRR